MSAGTKIPLERAQAAADLIGERWGLVAPACAIVGSVRREEPLVGDIEIIAPMPAGVAGAHDELHARIVASLDGDGLWGRRGIGVAVRGLRPGFRLAAVVVRLGGTDGVEPFELPVELYRYDPIIEESRGTPERPALGNRGWIQLMRTGPADFGRWFLGRWKRAYSIAPGSPASIDGYLVDEHGRRVGVATEADAFRRAGTAFIEPRERGPMMQRMAARAAGAHQ